MAAIFISTFILTSCSNTKTNRELFEENLDNYVESCAQPFIERGLDSTQAKSICICVMERMYGIDSTIFLKDFATFKELTYGLDEEFEKCFTAVVPDSLMTKWR